jgi:peptide-methionine (S)-S-oxide reductase
VNNLKHHLAGLITTASLAVVACSVLAPGRSMAEDAVAVPAPLLQEPQQAQAGTEKAVLAGGCFWGMQAVFQHLKGVKNAVSGYAGGKANTAQYETVSTGTTGHAESVEVIFDPHVINYATLLQVYFSVAHNPTELNFQGPDGGTQYRSAIFPQSDAQRQVAEAYIKQLGSARTFPDPIVTSIEPAKAFYPAEGYHQDYATLHPDSGYIATYDLPKVENLSRLFPDLYSDKPNLVKDAGSPS